MKLWRMGGWIVCVVVGFVSAARGETMLKVTAGWGDAIRLGRWTPVFLAVADPETRDVELQIHGTYGEKSLALLVHQTAVISPRPTTYALLFPINTQLSHIEVTVSDGKTGRTLATQALQNPAGFSTAGNVPKRLLGPGEFLVGISGEIGDALRLQAQLDKGGLAAGILDPIRLPENFVGYDGVSVLVLVAADFAELKPEQELGILRWVQRGGNLVVIPGTGAFPHRGILVDELPCDVGVNRAIDVNGFSKAMPTKVGMPRRRGEESGLGYSNDSIGNFNGRELSPRVGANPVSVMDQKGYEKRLGLGHVAVLPVDVSPLTFSDAQKANGFWRGILGGMVKVPGIAETTEMPLSDEEDILIAGPNAADSVGRGPRESVAIRGVLELLGATGSAAVMDWRKISLVFAGLFFLIGPVDSVLLMRLGQRPRNWVTLLGWIGLLVSAGAYGASWRGDGAGKISTFRLVDQVGDSLVGATDIVGVKSERSESVRLGLDEDEWWEPANQAERSFGRDRFVDANCLEDRKGCRPEAVKLVGGEAQAWHGEKSLGGRGYLSAKLSLKHDAAGKARLVGRIANVGTGVLSDIQIETAAGNFRVGGEIAAGKSVDVNEGVSGQAIGLSGLPGDIGDVSPDRADGMEGLVKDGFGCVYCQVAGEEDLKMGGGVVVVGRWEVLRAVVGLEK